VSVLHDEIYEQPEALRRVLAESRAAVNGLVAAARRRDVRYLVLAARGTSDNAATYAKYLFQIACGVPVALAAPSVHTLYDADVDYRGALVIGVSQSGAGEDIAEVVRRARRSGALTAALTNTADSPLAGEAEHVLEGGALLAPAHRVLPRGSVGEPGPQLSCLLLGEHAAGCAQPGDELGQGGTGLVVGHRTSLPPPRRRPLCGKGRGRARAGG